jgi:sulfane dehydrogenase subunit SoxC
MTEPGDVEDDAGATSRRRFLREGAALMGGAVLAGGLAGSEAVAAAVNGIAGRFHPLWNIGREVVGIAPLQDLDGIITPNGLFYERHHAGVPAIDPAQHRLMLPGLVDKPLIFTMDDIRPFPSESRIHLLECSGNPEYKKPYGKTGTWAASDHN